MKFLKTPSAPTNKLNQAFFEWWATLESNQACVSARELQSPATPCGLSPTLDTKKVPEFGKIYDLENRQSTKKEFDLYCE